MKTERVYQKDVYMKECAARIISCEPTDGGILLEFDKTIFFPQAAVNRVTQALFTYSAMKTAKQKTPPIQKSPLLKL